MGQVRRFGDPPRLRGIDSAQTIGDWPVSTRATYRPVEHEDDGDFFLFTE